MIGGPISSRRLGFSQLPHLVFRAALIAERQQLIQREPGLFTQV